MTTLLAITELAPTSQGSSKELEFEFLNNFESVHTRKAYKRDILSFIDFFQIVLGLDNLKSCSRLHLVAYKEYLGNSTYTPKTINRRMSSISSYFQFLMEKGFLDFNPADGVRRPKQNVSKETNDLTDDEVVQLFDVISKAASPLHRAILITFFTTGIRKSELIEIKLSDLQEINGEMTLRIKAKGGKILLKFLIPECHKAIYDYIQFMKIQGREIDNNDWIFQPSINPKEPSNVTRPLVPSSIDYIFKKYCKLAGITKSVSPHSARATYIGSSLQGGAELLKVSKDVGHSSVKTTESYNKRRNTIKDSPARNLGFIKRAN
jgi:site-specific recombinase XerD